MLRHPAVYWAVAVALGVLFVYASLDKIASPRDFARIVYHYQVIGPSATLGFVPANAFAVVLPWLELVCGVLLITGLWRKEAAALTAVMLVAFIGAVGWALGQGIDIQNCGCFTVGGEGRSAGVKLILGDVGLLMAALYLVVFPSRRAAPAPVGEPAPAL
jgi:uncharacterized membrane protein YphA (DoxX/SURF4 family)